MAQFIHIGILQKARIIHKEKVAREKVEEIYPTELFNYDDYDETSTVYLNPTISERDIEDLRTTVLDFIKSKGEVDGSFDAYRQKHIRASIDGSCFWAEEEFFLIYSSGRSFCHLDNGPICEATALLDTLIQKRLENNRLGRLVFVQIF